MHFRPNKRLYLRHPLHYARCKYLHGLGEGADSQFSTKCVDKVISTTIEQWEQWRRSREITKHSSCDDYSLQHHGNHHSFVLDHYCGRCPESASSSGAVRPEACDWKSKAEQSKGNRKSNVRDTPDCQVWGTGRSETCRSRRNLVAR